MIARLSTGLAALLALTGAAFAHAQLEKAVPGVGSTVTSASEIRLQFSESVEPKFTGVTLTAEGGAEQALGKPSVDPGDTKALIVKIAKPLAPGTYTVTWHAVSVDTHHTQGAFSFTVKP
jgi:methionine-rich copper-binding protein CopC